MNCKVGDLVLTGQGIRARVVAIKPDDSLLSGQVVIVRYLGGSELCAAFDVTVIEEAPDEV